MMLTREKILSADDLITELVNVPEWGGELYISTLSGAGRDAYEASIIRVDSGNNVTQDFNNMRAKLVARTAVDEEGNRLFSDDDVLDLGKKSAAALDRCFSVASRLNAVSDDDIEALAKNS